MTPVNRALSWVSTFVLVALLVGGSVFAFQLDRRTELIANINESAARIETAALHTEQVLTEVVEAGQTPEAVAQQEAVREALAQIRQIHDLLCSAPDFADATECADG